MPGPERLSDLVDFEWYVGERLRVLNADGGRAYDQGVRVFDCPLCGDTRGRGWANVLGFAAGCFNSGCVAEDGLPGGAIEFVRLLERLRSRGEAWSFLHREYPRRQRVRRAAAPPPLFADFTRLPRVSWSWTSAIGGEALEFAVRQWGVDVDELNRWHVGWVASGRYAWRIVIPIFMFGNSVSFQARTFRHAEPKYLFARHGDPSDPDAECGRPAAACLFNYDAVGEGEEFLLVEGAGDVMGWSARSSLKAVGLLGQSMTPEKLALIAAKRPRLAIVALDPGAAERRRALDHMADLEAWGVPAALGDWAGAKDAGAGADVTVDRVATTLPRLVQLKMGARR